MDDHTDLFRRLTPEQRKSAAESAAEHERILAGKPRTSVSQLTPSEIEELLAFCADHASLELKHVETVEDEDPDDDDAASHHPKYRVQLFAASPGELRSESLQFVVWEKTSCEYDEWDRYHWEIRLGEIVMPMGLSVAPVKVVKWFLDHGFQLWEDQQPRVIQERNEEFIRLLDDPATKEVQDACTDYIRAKLAHGAELQKQREAFLDASAKSPELRDHMTRMQAVGEQAAREVGFGDYGCEVYDEVDPVWWRGNDAGVRGALERFEEALDGEYDDEDPHFGHRPLTELVKRVRDLRMRVKALQRIEIIAGEAMSNGGYEVEALEEIFERAKEAVQ